MLTKVRSRIIPTLLALALLPMAPACDDADYEHGVRTDYEKGIEDWHHDRMEELLGESGWLNLAGLYWLRQGESTFGSDEGNRIIFPAKGAAAQMGSFFLHDTTVTIKIAGGVEVTHRGEGVDFMQLYPPPSDSTLFLASGTLRWNVIKRDGRLAVRLRDLASDHIDNFAGIDRFPVDQEWEISATFVPYDKPRQMTVPTIMGTSSDQTTPGMLNFAIAGKPYTLEPIGKLADDELFVIFTDGTTGLSTYGAGRYVWIKTPDASGRAIIDFNKAYNPPCAFTAFATCPLPPPQNKLAVKIEAGEKNYHLAMH